jgi:hypothetical protein
VPLQNRVDPFGALFVTPARGLFMGNRGGRIHSDDRKLTRRRWASRQWICCVLDFKGRQRDVWGRYYTELFFLDEVTALAAGHRPCFECRRKDAEAFAGAWQRAFKLLRRPRADEMDLVLHAGRLDGRAKRLHRRTIDDLPDGVFVAFKEGEQGAWAVRGDLLLRWMPEGYDTSMPRLRGATIDVLTPPAIVGALAAGYQPRWHPSAEVISSPP